MRQTGHLTGASVIIYNENQILLQQRKDNGMWGYVGGGIELGEKAEDGAKREMFEESGLVANTLKLYGVFSGPELYHIYPNGVEAHIIDIVYTCDDFSGELIPQPEEVLQLKWFDFDKIPENISKPVRPALYSFINEKLEKNSR